MFEIKKYNMYAFCAGIFSLALIYLLFEVKCFGSCDTDIIKPFFWGLLGLCVSLFLLLFFSEQVFIAWLKQIAWWFVLGTILLVLSVDPYTSGILSIDRTETAIYSMAILFIITTIYAFVMGWRFGKK